jgi:hypothetical protein
MGLRYLQKEVMEMIGRYVNENKIPTPFRGGIPGDDFLSALKELISYVSKSHKTLQHVV